MRRRAPLMSVVEAGYRLDGSEDDWIRRVAEATCDCLDDGHGVAAHFFPEKRSGPLEASRPVFVGAATRIGETFMTFLAAGGDPELGPTYRSHAVCATASDLLGARIAGELPAAKRYLHPLGIRDTLGVRIKDIAGLNGFIAVPLRRTRSTTPAVRAAWERVAAHLAAGLRLRRALAAAGAALASAEGEAVLTPSGLAEHAVGPARGRDARAELRRAVLAIERARGQLQRARPEAALAIWRALVAGRWSIVDRYEAGGRRYLVAHKNAPEIRDPRRLSTRERQVLAYARLGHSNRLIAYELGLAASSVATHLARAMRKLGVKTRRDLVIQPF